MEKYGGTCQKCGNYKPAPNQPFTTTMAICNCTDDIQFIDYRQIEYANLKQENAFLKGKIEGLEMVIDKLKKIK